MQLFVANVDGSNPRQITAGTAAFYCSAVSPDGRQVAASRSDSGMIQIWVFDMKGGPGRQLTRKQ